MADDTSPRPDLSNPRVRRTRARVLAVARDLLPDVGPIGLTYSLLAERATVTRQTLYRHWPTREALLVDLILEGTPTAYPQAGADPRAVATAFLKSLREGMSDSATATALMTLAAQADRDPVSAQALARITEDRREALNQLLEPSGRQVSPEEHTLLIGPVMFRRFLDRRPITDAYLDAVVAHWVSATNSG